MIRSARLVVQEKSGHIRNEQNVLADFVFAARECHGCSGRSLLARIFSDSFKPVIDSKGHRFVSMYQELPIHCIPCCPCDGEPSEDGFQSFDRFTEAKESNTFMHAW